MKSGAGVVLLVLLSLSLAACGGDSSGKKVDVALPDTPMSAADTAAIDKIVTDVYTPIAQEVYTPGLWVGVWDTSKGAFEKAYGESVRGSTKATVEDVWRIGSVSKTFTATIVLQLVDEGKLSLADTVADVDSDLADTYPQLKDLTIRQLLNMSSGIPDYINVPDGIVKTVSDDPSTVFSEDDLISAGLKGDVQPAGTAGYSTTNYIVLQAIAESVTGDTIQQLVADRIADSLGMSVTKLPPNDDTALSEPVAHGYLNDACVDEIKKDGGTATAWDDTTDWSASYGQGGGGMQSNLREFGLWGASELGSALLSDKLAAERTANPTVVPGVGNYGLGIVDYGEGFHGHSGEALGWEAIVLHNSEKGVTVAMAANSCAGAGAIFNRVLTGVIDQLGGSTK